MNNSSLSTFLLLFTSNSKVFIYLIKNIYILIKMSNEY
jgi:hypothetical protein